MASFISTSTNEDESSVRMIPGVRGTVVPAARVIIVGSGIAGCTAAIEACRRGSDVWILEKESKLGGNSLKAATGISGVNTGVQDREGVLDSKESLKFDTLREGRGKSDERLVDILANGAMDVIPWLEELGVPIDNVAHGGGHCLPRLHNFKTPKEEKVKNIGMRVMNALMDFIQKAQQKTDQDAPIETEVDENAPKGKIEILLNTQVTHLLQEKYEHCSHPRITGVKYRTNQEEEQELLGDAVILATGGFACDRFKGSLMAEFAPHLLDLPTTSGLQATGDGHKMAREVGATLVDMEEMQVHPTGFINPSEPNSLHKWLAPEAVRARGAIMVNYIGERFCNELGTRNYMVTEMFSKCAPVTKFPPMPEQEEKVPELKKQDSLSDLTVEDILPERMCPPQVVAYLILNQEVVDIFGPKTTQRYIENNIVRRCANVAEMAELYGIPEEKLRTTFQEYSERAQSNKTDHFGKNVFTVKNFNPDEPVYVAMVTPCLHYTCGGIKIGSSSEVLMRREDGGDTTILGLFAAGECTGGVHGGSRLVGNSMLDCLVFGRLAGRRASETTRDTFPALDPDEFTPLRMRHKAKLQHTTNFEFSFELPSPLQASGLKVGQYIAVRAAFAGDSKVRFYSPITRYDTHGCIDLLIKTSPNESLGMTQHIMDMKPGHFLEFSGPKGGFNFDIKEVPKIGLIAGGVGISPMIQIIRQVVYSKLNTEVTLLWGVEFMSELIYKWKLDKLVKECPNLKVVYVLHHPPYSWEGEVGFIDNEKNITMDATALRRLQDNCLRDVEDVSGDERAVT